MNSFQKILVANRGEIAVRIIRTAREMGIKTLAIYTQEEIRSMHVLLADKAVLLHGETLSDSYLNHQQIIRIAIENQADAIHPGYGLLAENADFADAVLKAGIHFIGPSPEQIRLMGQKDEAVKLAAKLGIPVLHSAKGSQHELLHQSTKLGFPLMIKAIAGGGGKGMQVIYSEKELAPALEKTARQAFQYFGNDELMIEKYVPHARHIEVQLLGDHHGKLIHLFERECSIQRRFQKIVEEAPSAFVSDQLRTKLCDAAISIGQSVNYRGLGTIEFLVDDDHNFWFLEMNTRIQVEHPVTEAITGIDLVKQQLLIAAGNSLQLQQNDIHINGHAIEARICAEDAERDFRPSTGRIQQLFIPERTGIRTDHFLQNGTSILPDYDSLLAKQIAHASTRRQALQQLRESLEQTRIGGIKSNIPFLLQLLENEQFQQNKISTSFIENTRFQENSNHSPLLAAYLFSHLFRKKENPRNIWEQIGFRPSGHGFRIWIDEQEKEAHFNFGQEKLQITIDDQSSIFQLTEFRNNQLLLNSEDKTLMLFVNQQPTYTEFYFRGKTFALRSNFIPEQVKIEKQMTQETKRFQSHIRSDLYGKVLSIATEPGRNVRQGEVLLILESMKTEFRIVSPQHSVIKSVSIQAGNLVSDGQILIELEEPEDGAK